MRRPTLSVTAAPNGRPRTPQSWVESVDIQLQGGRVEKRALEFFIDDAAGRAALLLLAYRLDRVKSVLKMFEIADRANERRI